MYADLIHVINKFKTPLIKYTATNRMNIKRKLDTTLSNNQEAKKIQNVCNNGNNDVNM